MTSDTVLTRFTALVADAASYDGYAVPSVSAFVAIDARCANRNVRRRIAFHVHAGKRSEHVGLVAGFASYRSSWNVG